MNCGSLARALDLVDLDARFDRDEATRHLGACAACRERYPEIASLLVSSPSGGRRERRVHDARFVAAAGLLVAVTLSLASRDSHPSAGPERSPAVSTKASPRLTASGDASSSVRLLPASASKVVYTSRRLLTADDSRAVECVVVRGGARVDLRSSALENLR